MEQKTKKELGTGYSRADWRGTSSSANRSSVDVCVVCALAEEAQAFLRVVEESCNLLWTSRVSLWYGYEYRLATFPNVKGELLRVHVSWLPRYGYQEMLSHLGHVIEEYQPRLVSMTGICAGDKRRVHLGDLVVAERTFTYDSGKVMRDEHGQALYQPDMITYQIHENTLGFLRLFDDWKPRVAALSRPLSKQQQRDWLLQRLFAEPTGSVDAIPLAEREKFAPIWRRLVRELQQGPEPFLSPMRTLRDKAMGGRLRFRELPFPFQDPSDARCHICPLASGSAVRSDGPFKEIQSLLRGAMALDMEGSAFGRVMEMERFRGIEWLIVKGVSDYADQDKDDLYRTYAAVASATYMLCFIEAYVTQERLPLSRYDHNANQDGQAQVWNIPYPHNLFFTGRDELLTRLSTAFAAGRATALSQSQALSGLGGIGKTQIAIEYAYQHRQDYQTVLWTLADTRESLVSGFVAIAELLNLPEKDEQDQTIVIKAVVRWLENHRKWLLILDNADDLAMVQEFLPSVFNGHILLTTRVQAVSGLASRIEVGTMPRDVGALFLLRRASLIAPDAPLEKATPSDIATAREICEELGGLPLALDQAGAYIEETRCSLSDYQSLHRTRRAEMLNKRGGLVVHYPKSVATTWSLSFEQVEQKHPAAANLLRFCAFLHPDAIPEEILTAGAKHLGLLLQPIASDPLSLNEAIAVLGAYSLISRDATARTLCMHRLVQAVLKDAMDEATQQEWVQRAILAVNEAFPAVEFTTWQQYERCLPHALACAELTKPGNPLLLEVASLQNRIGWYLHDRGRYSEAESWYMRALAIREEQLGLEHPSTANSINNLAVLYRAQGKYEQAEQLCLRALSICEREWGSEHPNTANSINNLAVLYDEQGKYERTEHLYQQALSIREERLGPEHPSTAISLNDLAVFYDVQGKYEQAEPLHVRAQLIRERQLGPEHPSTAQSLNNLAHLYHQQEKYEQAEQLYVQALAIREEQLGPQHPHTAQSLNNLAALYYTRGNYEQAESLYSRALSICEQQLGVSHPHTAQSLNNLAALYYTRGNYEQAESLYSRALSICKQQLGLQHPDTAQCLNNLAVLYDTQGKYEQAEPLYLRALAIWEHTLGLQHPHTRAALTNYLLLSRVVGQEVGGIQEEG
jgi:tetratricopeptide (TPR) repeat protein/nucleoside phosphorylase